MAFGFQGCKGPSQPGPSARTDHIRVMAYNIHHGEGMDEILDLQRIADLINQHDPDILALQEVDSNATRTGGINQAEVLAELTGLTPVFGSFMPYDGGSYGMAVLSKLPIIRSSNLRLPDGTEPRTSVRVQVVLPNTADTLQFVGIHFYRTDEERMAQAVKLEEHLSKTSYPTILAGDFNSTPESDVISYLDERWEIVDKGEDRLTFSSFDPVREIDFFMYKPAEYFRVVDQFLVDEPVASDHKPLVLDVEYTTYR